MYWVPLMSARPSLASSTTGVTPARLIASAPGTSGPSPDARLALADHRERQVRERRQIARRAHRALRRDARVHAACRASRGAPRPARGRTPLHPSASTCARSSIIPRTSATGRSGPMPVECERTRFFWSCAHVARRDARLAERAEARVDAVDARRRRRPQRAMASMAARDRTTARARLRVERDRAAAARDVLEGLERQGATDDDGLRRCQPCDMDPCPCRTPRSPARGRR